MTSTPNEIIQAIRHWLQDPLVARTASAAVVLLIAFFMVRVVQKAASRYIVDKDTRYRARKVISFVGTVAAIMAVGSVFSDKLSRLTVIFGVAGAGVAFALQEVIMSFAGWAAVSLGGYYKTGDRVQLGGVKGDVIDIGLLRTTLAETGQWIDGDQYNGRFVRVANSFVFKEPVVNYSGDFPFLWDEIQVPIRFGSDLKIAHRILTECAEEVCGPYGRESKSTWQKMSRRYPLESATTEPMVTLVFDHNWITYTVRYTVEFDRRRTTKHVLSTRILERIEAEPKVVVAASAIEVVQPRTFDNTAQKTNATPKFQEDS